MLSKSYLNGHVGVELWSGVPQCLSPDGQRVRIIFFLLYLIAKLTVELLIMRTVTKLYTLHTVYY